MGAWVPSAASHVNKWGWVGRFRPPPPPEELPKEGTSWYASAALHISLKMRCGGHFEVMCV